MEICEKLHDMSRQLKGPQLSQKLSSIPFYLADYVCVFTCSYDLLIHVRQGFYSLSGKTSYRQISRSLEVTRLDIIIIMSLRNLTAILVTLLPMC